MSNSESDVTSLEFYYMPLLGVESLENCHSVVGGLALLMRIA